MLGDGAGPRRLLPTQSVSGHVFRDRLHLGFRSDALEPSPRALLGLLHEQLQLLFFTFPKFALGNELVAGIPLVFAGVGEDRERTFDRRRARRQEYGTIIAIKGALRRTRSLASFKQATAKIGTGHQAETRPVPGASAGTFHERSGPSILRASRCRRKTALRRPPLFDHRNGSILLPLRLERSRRAASQGRKEERLNLFTNANAE